MSWGTAARVGVEQAYDQFGLEEAAGEVGDVGGGESSGAPGGYGFDDVGFAEAGVVGAQPDVGICESAVEAVDLGGGDGVAWRVALEGVQEFLAGG